MIRVSGDWLENPATQRVLAMLDSAGHQALLVGGCVRNALLGVEVADIDIATDARPETVMTLAQKAGFKAIPTGLDHGTITVVADSIPHEITTFRSDIDTDGRHAVVQFSTSVNDDAARRDFTMNALYARADGTVVDPLGGLDDLHARRIRFIKNPKARITEDYLRILRFFRFHAWYGDPNAGLDAEGLAACAELADGLETLSKERVTAELLKLLNAPIPSPSVASMSVAGCLHRILPQADAKALPILIDFEQQFDLSPDPLRRLASFGSFDAAENLRLSKAQLRQLTLLRSILTDYTSASELGYRHGFATGLDMVLIFAAMTETAPSPTARADLATGAAATFPVKPHDLMPQFEGPALGQKLAELEAEWIESGFAKNKAELLRFS